MKRWLVGAAVLVALVGAACSSDGAGGSGESVASVTVEETGRDPEPVVLPASAPTSPVSEMESTETVPVASVPAVSVPAELEVSAVQPEGFTTAMVEITKADGSTCEVCMWLADTSDERGRGLMGVTDLGAAEGMAFVFEQPTSGSFFMFQTVTPLSIAWFAPDGGVVSITDMDPCVSDDSSQCERFPAGGDFDLAIEVFQGDLGSIGITDGATARLIAGTEADGCPAGG